MEPGNNFARKIPSGRATAPAKRWLPENPNLGGRGGPPDDLTA